MRGTAYRMLPNFKFSINDGRLFPRERFKNQKPEGSEVRGEHQRPTTGTLRKDAPGCRFRVSWAFCSCVWQPIEDNTSALLVSRKLWGRPVHLIMTTETAARACDFGGSIEEMDPSIGELVVTQVMDPETSLALSALMSPLYPMPQNGCEGTLGSRADGLHS